jgi:hypothetical protein
LSDIGTVADGHEALQVERELLASRPELERSAAHRLGQYDESLLEIELVRVDRG